VNAVVIPLQDTRYPHTQHTNEEGMLRSCGHAGAPVMIIESASAKGPDDLMMEGSGIRLESERPAWKNKTHPSHPFV